MPPLSSSQILPPSNWQDFESLCRDLWRELWNDPNAQKHGRQGQPQHGVDVFGRPGEGLEWAGVQCKLKSQITGSRLTRGEIEAEVKKAHSFNPALSSLTIATTAPEDTKTQEAARLITEGQLAEGSFPVTVKAWDEISEELTDYPELLEKHYPHLLPPGSDQAAREAYLRRLWSQLLPLPLTVLGGGQRDDVSLSAVYTALDVRAEARVGGREGVEAKIPGGEGVSVDLKGDAHYLERLRSRIEAEAKAARSEKKRQRLARGQSYRRRLTALEAAAAAQRLVLLGAAGSGKSSFARHLALSLAGEALGRQEANLRKLNGVRKDESPRDELVAWPYEAPLPIFLELRKLVRSTAFKVAAEPGAEEILACLADLHPELEELAAESLGKRGEALLILDGLDETPSAEAERERLKQAIGNLVRHYPECRVLVTSRPYAYAEGSPWRLDGFAFDEAHLAPLSERQAQAFIAGWYAQLVERGQVDAERAQERGAGLWREISSTAYLRPLAELPLMLTMMTDLHASTGGRLRGGRAGIYEASVELLLDRWNEVRDVPEGGRVSEQLGMEVEEIRRALERLAFEVHRDRGADTDQPAEITDADLWKALDRERSHERVVDERRVMDYLHQRSGILMGESPSVYRFPHRSYQEYLAAGHLIRNDFPELLREVLTEGAVLWREVVQLSAGQVSATPFMLWSLLETVVPGGPAEATEVGDPGFERALYAGLAIRETGVWRRASELEREKLEPIRQWLERSVELGALAPADRAAAGRTLALLGDRRSGIGIDDDGVPDIAWIEVPAGSFLMGSTDGDKGAFGSEKPQQSLELGRFSISRYPVTNAQYAAFTGDGGYTETWRDCWTDEGWKWKAERDSPYDAIDPDFLLANHPRVNVNFFEAAAFCRWLSQKLGREVRLPSEAEWEKAARGQDGRIYPWGDDFDAAKCNTLETGIGKTCAVGMFPSGASPYGAMDMSGNVWEWTSSPWTDNYAVHEKDAGAPDAAPGARVYRGGSYWFDARFARSAFRSRFGPVWSDQNHGFRVLLPAPERSRA